MIHISQVGGTDDDIRALHLVKSIFDGEILHGGNELDIPDMSIVESIPVQLVPRDALTALSEKFGTDRVIRARKVRDVYVDILRPPAKVVRRGGRDSESISFLD